MSGIVNTTGAVSGVIGTTEIDYEEGTWTPSWHGSTSTTGGGYSQQEGFYTKVGNLVTCRMSTRFSSEPSMNSSYIFLKGFPFVTSVQSWYCPGNVFLFDGWGVTRIMFGLQFTNGTTQAYLHDVESATASWPTATSGEMNTNTVMATSFTYPTLGVPI